MVAIVSGASGGIGSRVARRLYRAGFRVYGLSLGRARNIDFMTHIELDVADGAALRRAVALIAKKEGRLDLVVACAGISLGAPAERAPPRAARRLFDVNFFGASELCAAAAPYLKARRGRIVVVSSMAGLFPIPYLAHYSASKAALLAYAGALRNELWPYGVFVSAVLPGGVKTRFTARRKLYAQFCEIAPNYKKASARLAAEEQGGLSPDAVAGAIVKTALRKRPPAFVLTGARYRALALGARLLSADAALYLLRRRYFG